MEGAVVGRTVSVLYCNVLDYVCVRTQRPTCTSCLLLMHTSSANYGNTHAQKQKAPTSTAARSRLTQFASETEDRGCNLRQNHIGR